MLQRAMHVFSGFALLFFFGAQTAWSVSFERIDVASHVGEPFYAEVPLRLDGNESLAKTSVDLGSSSDYRILEVYRDSVVNNIRTDIVDDERGPRVTITSDAAIDTAFFNLVLKVRYGRATHYKKMPIFLEAATAELLSTSAPVEAAVPVNAATVKPESSDAFITKVPEGAKAAFEEPEEDSLEIIEAESAFKAHGDWARTSRYGPMVFGDTITVVAQRLRLDDRFSNKQVMVALFEKNKAQFDKENVNLIKAGTYLDVPTAEEVNQVSVERAKQVLSEQNKAWKAMVKQPKYAAVADAQKTRYTRRVRVGQNASGVASAPMATPEASKEPKKAEAIVDEENTAAPMDDATQAKLQAAEQALTKRNEEFTALQEKMAAMERRLERANAKDQAEPQAKPVVTADSAALEAQSKRLEIVVSRLKNQLEEARAKANENQGVSGWVMYALVGLGLLILALAAAVVLLLRREPKHPAEQEQNYQEAFDETAQEADAEDIATKMMDADDFDMPAESPADSPVDSMTDTADDIDPIGDAFEEEPLEEIPDFTDDETGQMEAFDAGDDDETPDPSVNYLEEADVYLRYGMEDEAEKQVRMALKLKPEDPEAHAKMVQIQRAKGDDSSEAEYMSAAKAALSGAALASFEGLLSGSSAAAAEEDVSDLSSEPFTGDDTGIVDFGEINFDAPKDVMEPDLLDTGEMDFGEVEEEDNLSSSEDDISLDGIDFGDINFESDTAGDDLNLEPLVSEDAKDTDVDLSDINFDTEQASDAGSDDVMLPEALDTGELDFGDFATEATDESEEVPEAEADTADELDFTSLDFDSDTSSDEVMAPEALDTGELDFGEVGDVTSDLTEESDSEEVDLDFSDMSIDSDTPTDEVMSPEAMDTGELDFGEVGDVASDVTEDSDSEEVDLDFSDMSIDSDTPTDEVMSPEAMDTGELDFGEVGDVAADVTEDSDSEAVDFDFSDMGLSDSDISSELDTTDKEVSEKVESETGLDDSMDLGDFDLDFDTSEVAEDDSVEDSLDIDTGSFDMDSTAAVSVEDETIVVSSDDSDVDTSDALNDREVDQALADAEEDAAALAVDLDMDADDPFASANDSLAKAESDSLSEDLSDETFADLDGEGLDLLSLDDDSSDDVSDVELQDLDSKDLSEDTSSEIDEPESSGDSVTTVDLEDDADSDLLESIDEGLSSDDIADLESISIDLTGLDIADVDDDLADDAIFSTDLDPQVESAVEEGKQIDEDLSPEVKMDDDFLSGIGDDLDAIDTPDADTNAVEDDEFGLEDLDMGDFDLDDLGDEVEEETPAPKASVMDDFEDFDSTVVMNKMADDMKDVIGQPESEVEVQAEEDFDSYFDNLDDALEDISVEKSDADPMSDDYSATAELNQIEANMESISDPMSETSEVTSELDDLMNDLHGLLDEDEKPKK